MNRLNIKPDDPQQQGKRKNINDTDKNIKYY